MEKISVIIPVFNVKQYIVECFDSILDQAYPNFEVICVDDGSTDGSGETCDEYAARDERFKSIRITNQGVGKARNLALENATGELTFFLDPDDLIAPGALLFLADTMRNHECDIVLGVSHNFRGNPRDIPPFERSATETVHSGNREVVERVVFGKGDLRPLTERALPTRVNYEFFSCLYRTSLLRQKNIQFLPISYGEDTFVLFSYLLESNAAVVADRVVYLHRRNPTSTTFRYHPDYLTETNSYYQYYTELFRQKAPAYLERAIEGLDAQYFFRCVSAVDRELFIGGGSRTVNQMLATVAAIRRDRQFSKLLTKRNVGYISQKQLRIIMHAVRLNIHAPLVFLIRCRQTRRGRVAG